MLINMDKYKTRREMRVLKVELALQAFSVVMEGHFNKVTFDQQF